MYTVKAIDHCYLHIAQSIHFTLFMHAFNFLTEKILKKSHVAILYLAIFFVKSKYQNMNSHLDFVIQEQKIPLNNPIMLDYVITSYFYSIYRMGNKPTNVRQNNDLQDNINPKKETTSNAPSLSNSQESKNESLANQLASISANSLIHKFFLYVNKDGYFSIMSPSHVGIKCDACGKEDFVVDRYKCLICTNFDLCGDCFEARNIAEPHIKSHPMVRYSGPNEIFGDCVESESVTYKKFKEQFDGVVHETVTCKGCNTEQIVGLRLKCDECNDFDLCSTCFEKKVEKNDHKSDHFILICYSVRNINPSDIEFLEELGNGAFGTVHKAKLISKNKIVACKVLEYNLAHKIMGVKIDKIYQSFIRELLAYNEFNSNYIIKTYGSCIVNNNNNNCKFYLLTEFMENGSLAALLTKEPDLSYRCRLSMACNIASGMKRIHEKNFIHRDIRPDNIFVSKNYVAKIGDMGIARLQDKFEQHSLIGLNSYMPKEFYTRKYNEKLDVFTFGLTLYHLITGNPHSFNNGEIELDNKPVVFGELIDQCLQDDPNKRPTASSLENWLSLYQKCFWELIRGIEVYPQLRKEDRTDIFIKSCNTISKLLF